MGNAKVSQKGGLGRSKFISATELISVIDNALIMVYYMCYMYNTVLFRHSKVRWIVQESPTDHR